MVGKERTFFAAYVDQGDIYKDSTIDYEGLAEHEKSKAFRDLGRDIMEHLFSQEQGKPFVIMVSKHETRVPSILDPYNSKATNHTFEAKVIEPTERRTEEGVFFDHAFRMDRTRELLEDPPSKHIAISKFVEEIMQRRLTDMEKELFEASESLRKQSKEENPNGRK